MESRPNRSHFSTVTTWTLLIMLCSSQMSCDSRLNKAALEGVRIRRIGTALEPQVPLLVQARAMFPETKVSIWKSRGVWNASSGSLIYGRYVLVISQDILVDEKATKVTGFGRLEFQFNELEFANANGEKQIEAINHCGNRERILIDIKMWRSLVDANGNFSQIGVCLITNNPITTAEFGLRGL